MAKTVRMSGGGSHRKNKTIIERTRRELPHSTGMITGVYGRYPLLHMNIRLEDVIAAYRLGWRLMNVPKDYDSPLWDEERENLKQAKAILKLAKKQGEL